MMGILLIKKSLPFLSVQGFKPRISTPFSFEIRIGCFLVDVLQYIFRWHDTYECYHLYKQAISPPLCGQVNLQGKQLKYKLDLGCFFQ